MGIWDFMGSSMDQTKQNAHNLSLVKNACYGVQRFYSSYWPDAEARAKIGLFAKIFTAKTADYAMHEGIKLLPGGKAFSKIVSQTMRDVKSRK